MYRSNSMRGISGMYSIIPKTGAAGMLRHASTVGAWSHAPDGFAWCMVWF